MSLQPEELQDVMNYLCLAATASITGAVISIGCTAGHRENFRNRGSKSKRSKRPKRSKSSRNRSDKGKKSSSRRKKKLRKVERKSGSRNVEKSERGMSKLRADALRRMEPKPLVSPNANSDRFNCNEEGCRKGQCSKDARHSQQARRSASQRSLRTAREKRMTDGVGKSDEEVKKAPSQKSIKIEDETRAPPQISSEAPMRSVYLDTGKSSYGELSKPSMQPDQKSVYYPSSNDAPVEKKKSKKSIKQTKIEQQPSQSSQGKRSLTQDKETSEIDVTMPLISSSSLNTAANAEIPGATSAPDPVNDMLAMKLATRLLNAFDQRNYTEFNDFDVRFTFDDCRHDYEAAEFLAKVEKFRNTFAAGTVIKYAFLDAMRIVRQYDGIQFTIHVEYLGQHHDVLANFQRIRLTTGSRWRWVHAWKSNCVQDHTNVIPESSMRQKILS
ncbi:hypothetical protein L5515_000768 [Caenorhabditis briggsae]|uniref:Uncharacterized protein n=1 Tax=Caenorhabditis briggsae TaxID=6238 RepID=A0AAE9E0Z9_CAEBR|nr:hypothetical protein L5515_000768 [Caenorhabditis briggsae]